MAFILRGLAIDYKALMKVTETGARYGCIVILQGGIDPSIL